MISLADDKDLFNKKQFYTDICFFNNSIPSLTFIHFLFSLLICLVLFFYTII